MSLAFSAREYSVLLTEYRICKGRSEDLANISTSVVAKKLGSRLKIKSRRLKEGSKCLVLSVEVPVVLYQAITGQKSSR